VLQRLGPEYVAVRPDHLAALYGQYLAREGVLLRFPAVAAAVEGRPLLIAGTVRNVGEGPVSLSFRVSEGLGEAAVAPESAELAVAGERSVEVSGTPTADAVTVAAFGPGEERTARIELRRIPASELAAPLPVAPGARLATARWLEAEALAHRSGEVVKVEGAGGGEVWSAQKGETQPGYIVFGPYHPLESGKYLALFRLRRLDEGNGAIARLDTCVAGGSPQTSVLDVDATMLPVGQWRTFPLLLEHPEGNYEVRVEWSGAASIEVDSVVLLRVTE